MIALTATAGSVRYRPAVTAVENLSGADVEVIEVELKAKPAGRGIGGFPQITALDGPGSEGLSLRQTYTVTMMKNGVATDLTNGKTLFAVPSNAGPLTMPKYRDLFNQGIYDLGNGVRVFAGTVDDPFYIDLGAAFDSFNFRMGVGGILPPAVDADDTHNYAPDAVAGFNVNSIVLEVPITMLTLDGKLHTPGEKQAVIGTYGETDRQRITIHRLNGEVDSKGAWRQVNREGNSLINELIIGTGSKDLFSVSDPQNDAQFANFFLDPLLAHLYSSILNIPIPPAPRTDLLPLVQYMAPICPGCGPNDRGPIADLLRLNTGIPPTPVGSQKRLGFLAGDLAGFPQGRRPIDDVVDIASRAVVMAALAAVAQTATLSAGAPLSPAERSMAQANRLIEKNPKNFEAYNALALALSRRTRETSNLIFYAQAEETLKKSFEISPGNFDGEKIHVWLLLGKHEFAAAREEARKLNKKMPDDVMVYGFLTDANIELGNYKEAEDSAQLMLDLRPGNLPGLTRAAYLRELFGDLDGSIELMNMAYQSTPPSEVEDRAWILSQIGHLQLMSGKITDTDNTLQQALALFPGYHYALGNLAKVRIEQKRYEDAVNVLQQRYEAAQNAENLYDLAEALELAGHRDQAQKAFAEFETKSRLESVRADNSDRELIFYYADHAHLPAKALEVAQGEYARRHDVFTLDAYAWALHVNGRDTEARTQIAATLAVGIRDAKMLRHAGEIALSTGDRATAERYLLDSTKMNAPGSSQARELLASLSAPKKN